MLTHNDALIDADLITLFLMKKINNNWHVIKIFLFVSKYCPSCCYKDKFTRGIILNFQWHHCNKKGRIQLHVHAHFYDKHSYVVSFQMSVGSKMEMNSKSCIVDAITCNKKIVWQTTGNDNWFERSTSQPLILTKNKDSVL